jgi:hypothetical protein
MSAYSYLVDRSNPDDPRSISLPADFVARFVATAKRNKTFEMHRNAKWPDTIHMSGKDHHKRRLSGTWSTDPSYLIDGQHCVIFYDIAQDPPNFLTRD